jgi:hypothetical protein
MSSTRSRSRTDETPRLVVRRAHPKDRGAILNMSEKIWGGTDYLPLVWDAWLADTEGVLLTATLDGRPVGVSKISILSPGEVWLEGLRLDPGLHGRGLVRQINRAGFREVAKLNPRSVRYSTGAGNAPSRHLGEARGFWLVARTRWLLGKALQGSPTASRAATPNELGAVQEYVRGSRCYAATSGLYAVGWKFPALDRRRLKGLIAEGRVIVSPRRGRIRGLAVYDVGDIDGDLCLGFLDGPEREMEALAGDVLRAATRLGHSDSSAMLPEGSIADAARRGGYNLIMPADAVVYELGARGSQDGREPFEELLLRTYRRHEGEAADRLAALLIDKAPRRLARENVRDFVMRRLLPDSRRDAQALLEGLSFQLESWPLRAVLRGITEHFLNAYGIGGDSAKTTARTISFWHSGRRVATARVRRKSVRLTLGPGFGPCFDARTPFDAEEIEFLDGSRDENTGRFEALSMKLTAERQIPAAVRAIDTIMKAVLR